MNPRRYDRFHSQLHPSLREGAVIIQPFRDDLRAIGFDLDWTLSYYPLSTRQLLEEAANRSLFPVDLLGDLDSIARRYNELWLGYERLAESTDALRLTITTKLLDELGVGDQQIAVQMSQACRDIRQETGILSYPGVDALLADLKTKYKLALYTNGPSDMQWEKIRALGFDQVMDVIIVAGDVDIYKPDPRAFALLLGELNVAAEQTLFVGDNYDTDIVGAHNAGMATAWVKRRENETIEGIQPTFVTSETALLREVLL